MNNYPQIIILVGCGRSGTTYLSEVLRDSMDIGFRHEPKFIVPIYKRLHQFGNLKELHNMHKLVDEILATIPFGIQLPFEFDEVIEHIDEPSYTNVLYAVFRLTAEKQGKRHLGYKDPSDVVHMLLLAELFPTARFVHIIRDGRDVALSFLKLKWGPTNLYSGACYWANMVSIGHRDGKLLGNRYFEFRYEDLILETDRVARELGMFINNNHHVEQVEKLIQHINNTKKKSGVQSWKLRLDINQRRLIELVAGNVLQACGYSTEFDAVGISPSKAIYYQMDDFLHRVWNRLIREPRLNKKVK